MELYNYPKIDLEFIAALMNDGGQDKDYMPEMVRIKNQKYCDIKDRIYTDNKTLLEYCERDNLFDQSKYKDYIHYDEIHFTGISNEEKILNIHTFKDETDHIIFPTCSQGSRHSNISYWINDFGIMFDDGSIYEELDKFTITIEIGGCNICRIYNLITDDIINSRIKYINGTFTVPLSYLLCTYKHPLTNIGLLYHELRIYIKYNGTNMTNKKLNFYINYSRCCSDNMIVHMKDVNYIYSTKCSQREVKNLDRLQKIIHQEQSIREVIKDNEQKINVWFNHPTHIFYIYFDDYGDYLEDIHFEFERGMIFKWTCLDIEKTKIRDNNNIYNHIGNVRSALNKILDKLPISNDVCKYLIMPSSVKNISMKKSEKVIYKFEMDPTIENPFSFEMPKLYLNLSRIDTIRAIIKHKYNGEKTMHINVTCLNKNLLRSISGMSGLAYSN
jgi:hypothetical protein